MVEHSAVKVPVPADTTLSAESTVERLSGTGAEGQLKQVILIRHGESLWNQMIGQGIEDKVVGEQTEKAWAEFRESFKEKVRNGRASTVIENAGDFFKGIRGLGRKVTKVVTNADSVHLVDHGLSRAGVVQARRLGRQVEALAQQHTLGSSPGRTSESSTLGSRLALLECRHWFISPFLRAIQTAAFALTPLCRKDPILMQVTPDAREIMSSKLSHDCHGKEGNVGYSVVLRALSKLTEVFAEEEDTATVAAAAATGISRVGTRTMGDAAGDAAASERSFETVPQSP